MGLRGPAPKPEAARLRKNADYRPVTHLKDGETVKAPYPPDETWHPHAIALYEAYENSPQATLFVETDWMACYLMCEAISRELKPQFIGFRDTHEVLQVNGRDEVRPATEPLMAKLPIKGASMSAITKMMTGLLTTEADRRRLSIEIDKLGRQAEPEQTAGQAVVADFMEKFAKKKQEQQA